jgi:hypothetical protein
MRSILCGNVFDALIAEFGCVNSGEKMFPGTEKDRRNGQVHFVQLAPREGIAGLSRLRRRAGCLGPLRRLQLVQAQHGFRRLQNGK